MSVSTAAASGSMVSSFPCFLDEEGADPPPPTVAVLAPDDEAKVQLVSCSAACEEAPGVVGPTAILVVLPDFFGVFCCAGVIRAPCDRDRRPERYFSALPATGRYGADRWLLGVAPRLSPATSEVAELKSPVLTFSKRLRCTCGAERVVSFESVESDRRRTSPLLLRRPERCAVVSIVWAWSYCAKRCLASSDDSSGGTRFSAFGFLRSPTLVRK
mmetsp:Transcript_16864/g.41760  ORF Transcript_16864/g.41760 Transcript_16864/m.41760 type:complete len:215 (-) Transcript_16864:331-975(-)